MLNTVGRQRTELTPSSILARIIQYTPTKHFIKNKDFKFNDGKEDHRVFVKGFPAEISKERIEEIFKDCGTIVDIRLPENRQVINDHRRFISVHSLIVKISIVMSCVVTSNKTNQ